MSQLLRLLRRCRSGLVMSAAKHLASTQRGAKKVAKGQSRHERAAHRPVCPWQPLSHTHTSCPARLGRCALRPSCLHTVPRYAWSHTPVPPDWPAYSRPPRRHPRRPPLLAAPRPPPPRAAASTGPTAGMPAAPRRVSCARAATRRRHRSVGLSRMRTDSDADSLGCRLTRMLTDSDAD